jgi:hypothetical protein
MSSSPLIDPSAAATTPVPGQAGPDVAAVSAPPRPPRWWVRWGAVLLVFLAFGAGGVSVWWVLNHVQSGEQEEDGEDEEDDEDDEEEDGTAVNALIAGAWVLSRKIRSSEA